MPHLKLPAPYPKDLMKRKKEKEEVDNKFLEIWQKEFRHLQGSNLRSRMKQIP